MPRSPIALVVSVSVLALSTLGAASPWRAPLRVSMSPEDASEATRAPGSFAECAPGTIPDGDACVHLPRISDDDAPDSLSAANIHRERTGAWRAYEEIPRRPDRPASYDAYLYPVPPGVVGKDGRHYVVSGFDLDRPDSSQRRGATLHAVGHGGVDLPDPRGTPVKLVALEHQQGDADVVYVGPLFGTTVVTRHTLREGGRLRDYLLLFGHLDGVAPGLSHGTALKEGDLVGFVGDTGSPELVHLHLEARRVRENVDVTKKPVGSLLAEDVSVVCDPRNVLRLHD